MSEPVLRKLRILHRWAGLALAIPLMLQGASGLMLAASPPFEAMRTPAARDPTEPPHSIGAIVAAARADAPTGLMPLRYQAGSTPDEAAVVDLARPSERTVEARVFIDPGSLETLDWRDHPDGFYRWVHSIHERFLIPGPLGHSIVGWFGIGLVWLGISGIPIWWPRRGQWKSALSVASSARGFHLHRALHGAAGGWAVAFLLLQSLSGVSMAFPGWFGTTVNTHPARAADPHEIHDIDVDAVAAAIRATAPGARLTSFRFPTRPGQPVIATLQPEGRANGAPPLIVAAVPYDGRIISVRDPRKDGLAAGTVAWLRAIHSGEGLGAAWRAVVCLLGITLPLFPITGIAMWLLRRQDRHRPEVSPILRGATE